MNPADPNLLVTTLTIVGMWAVVFLFCGRARGRR